MKCALASGKNRRSCRNREELGSLDSSSHHRGHNRVFVAGWEGHVHADDDEAVLDVSQDTAAFSVGLLDLVALG